MLRTQSRSFSMVNADGEGEANRLGGLPPSRGCDTGRTAIRLMRRGRDRLVRNPQSHVHPELVLALEHVGVEVADLRPGVAAAELFCGDLPEVLAVLDGVPGKRLAGGGRRGFAAAGGGGFGGR